MIPPRPVSGARSRRSRGSRVRGAVARLGFALGACAVLALLLLAAVAARAQGPGLEPMARELGYPVLALYSYDALERQPAYWPALRDLLKSRPVIEAVTGRPD